jgi:hypothetical protein
LIGFLLKAILGCRINNTSRQPDQRGERQATGAGDIQPGRRTLSGLEQSDRKKTGKQQAQHTLNRTINPGRFGAN